MRPLRIDPLGRVSANDKRKANNERQLGIAAAVVAEDVEPLDGGSFFQSFGSFELGFGQTVFGLNGV